jgi:hypothetical protein
MSGLWTTKHLVAGRRCYASAVSGNRTVKSVRPGALSSVIVP